VRHTSSITTAIRCVVMENTVTTQMPYALPMLSVVWNASVTATLATPIRKFTSGLYTWPSYDREHCSQLSYARHYEPEWP
jgi:hypothetical protein